MIKRALPAVRTRVEALRATAEVVGVDYPGPESMAERLDVRRVAGVRERAFPHALSGFPASTGVSFNLSASTATAGTCDCGRTCLS